MIILEDYGLEAFMAKRWRRRKNRIKRLLVLALLIALGVTTYQSNFTLSVEEFTFTHEDLPAEFSDFTIAHLSDLHGTVPDGTLASLTAAAPDMIVLTGDLVDENCTVDAVADFTAALPAIAPTYYVTGNHEWAAHCAEELIDLLTSQGITCLRNEAVALQRGDDVLILAGIEDPNGYADQKTPAQVAAEVYASYGDPFWILLAHRNNYYETYAPLGAHLILSGHGHGGIIRLPFTDGLLGVDRDFFPTWTAGFYHDFDSTLFVSRGMGNVGRTFRWGNPPQLALITLESEA